jgi:integrase
MASLLDKSDIYPVAEQLGHAKVASTEVYVRYLKGKGSQRRYTRNCELFGSLVN